MPLTNDTRSKAKSEVRQVSSLLHTLRGEDFRHTRNLQRMKARSPSIPSHNSPTLPFDRIFSDKAPNADRVTATREAPPVRLGPEGVLEYAYPRGRVPGPPPPRSWSGLFGAGKRDDVDEPARRAEALSLIFSQLPSGSNISRTQLSGSQNDTVLPLTLVCMRYLLSFYSDSQTADSFAEDLVLYLPPHLRRDLLRWTAVYSPLPGPQLTTLCEPDGHVEGELIIIGPQASLSRDSLRSHAGGRNIKLAANVGDSSSENAGRSTDEEWAWDSPSSDLYTPPPLQTVILLNTSLPISILLNLPPTLTHLALLALPTPSPIHRLPRICPLIEVLDLSFNPWLNTDGGTGDAIITRVEWSRWSRLRMLGLRGCEVGTGFVRQLNKGRWVDVEVVGVDSGTTDLELAMSNLVLDG